LFTVYVKFGLQPGLAGYQCYSPIISLWF